MIILKQKIHPPNVTEATDPLRFHSGLLTRGGEIAEKI